MQVKLYSKTASDWCKYGTTYDVVLQRGNEYVSCEEVLIVEEDDLDSTFAEWQAFADAGENGYAHWVA